MTYNSLEKHIIIVLSNKRKLSNLNLLVFQVCSHPQLNVFVEIRIVFCHRHGRQLLVAMGCSAEQNSCQPFSASREPEPWRGKLGAAIGGEAPNGNGYFNDPMVRKQFLLTVTLLASNSQQCRCYLQFFCFCCREASNLALQGSLPSLRASQL